MSGRTTSRVLCMLLSGALLSACASVRGTAPAAPTLDVAAITREAEARYAAGDWPAAANAYQRLLEHDGHDADLWFRLANARARAGNPDGAVAAYREVLARDAGYSKAGFNLGMVLLREAAETYRALEVRDGTDPALRAQATQLRAAVEKLLADVAPPVAAPPAAGGAP